MPFGLSTAPATFQRAMNLALEGLSPTICMAYLDDVVVFSRTFDDHVRDIAAVLQRFREFNLKLKGRKCEIAREELNFLGHRIGKSGISVNPDKTEVVAQCAAPTTQEQVRQFLGLANYYRRHIQDYAKVAHPLFELLKKKVKFVWGEEEENAFAEIKKRLTEAPTLAFPVRGKPFNVHTDASDYAMGAVLEQMGNDEDLHPVAFGSQAFNKHERNYGVTEKETLAVVWALKTFRYYCLGTEVDIYTDHSAIRFILLGQTESHKLAGRLARWAMQLQEYKFRVFYKKGTLHTAADALSREPIAKNEGFERLIVPQEEGEVACLRLWGKAWGHVENSVDRKWVLTAETAREAADQLEPFPMPAEDDPVRVEARKQGNEGELLQRLSTSKDYESHHVRLWMPVKAASNYSKDAFETKLFVEQNEEPLYHRVFRQMQDEGVEWLEIDRAGYIKKDGVLFRYAPQIWKIVLDQKAEASEEGREKAAGEAPALCIPATKGKEAAAMFHNNCWAGHLGVEAAYQTILHTYYWPGMRDTLRQVEKQCLACQQAKPGGRRKAPLFPISVSRPGERLGIDIVSGFTKSSKGSTCMIVLIDFFTKYMKVFAKRDHTAKTVIWCIKDWVSDNGVPQLIHTDNGPELIGTMLQEYKRDQGIATILSTAYHSQSLGVVERVNGTIIQYLRSMAQFDQRHWDEYLTDINFVINSAVHSTTGFTPFFLHNTRHPKCPPCVYETINLSDPRCPRDFVQDQRILQQRAWGIARRNMAQAQEAMKRAYDRTAKPSPIKVGDWVIITNHVIRGSDTKKLSPLFTGLHQVVSRDGLNFKAIEWGKDKEKEYHVNRAKVVQIRPGLPVTQCAPLLSELATMCDRCHGTVDDEIETGVDRVWVSCGQCGVYLHEHCANQIGTDGDFKEMICGRCLTENVRQGLSGRD